MISLRDLTSESLVYEMLGRDGGRPDVVILDNSLTQENIDAAGGEKQLTEAFADLGWLPDLPSDPSAEPGGRSQSPSPTSEGGVPLPTWAKGIEIVAEGRQDPSVPAAASKTPKPPRPRILVLTQYMGPTILSLTTSLLRPDRVWLPVPCEDVEDWQFLRAMGAHEYIELHGLGEITGEQKRPPQSLATALTVAKAKKKLNKLLPREKSTSPSLPKSPPNDSALTEAQIVGDRRLTAFRDRLRNWVLRTYCYPSEKQNQDKLFWVVVCTTHAVARRVRFVLEQELPKKFDYAASGLLGPAGVKNKNTNHPSESEEEELALMRQFRSGSVAWLVTSLDWAREGKGTKAGHKSKSLSTSAQRDGGTSSRVERDFDEVPLDTGGPVVPTDTSRNPQQESSQHDEEQQQSSQKQDCPGVIGRKKSTSRGIDCASIRVLNYDIEGKEEDYVAACRLHQHAFGARMVSLFSSCAVSGEDRRPHDVSVAGAKRSSFLGRLQEAYGIRLGKCAAF